MRTRTAAIATTLFAVAAPGTVAGVIPRRLRGEPSEAMPDGPLLRAAAGALVAAGTAVIADSFARFVRARGTPAPVAETEELVVDGLYRVSRNPQYLGVASTIVGQALLWRSPRVLGYAAAVVVAFDVWVRMYEEPRLRRRFGAQYVRYTMAVPRWGPRLRSRRRTSGDG